MVNESRLGFLIGPRSLGNAMMRFRANPFRAAAGRRLWGPAPAVALAAAVLAAVVAAPWFPLVERFFPWFLVDVGELVWSIPALFAVLVAWRARTLRDSLPDLEEPTLPFAERATHYFEAAAVPVAVATLMMAIGIELSVAASPLLTGGEAVWPSIDFALHGISRSLVIVAVTAGVWSTQRKPGNGFRKLMVAGLALFGTRLAIGLTVPWMSFGWTWIPGFGHHLGPARTVIGANLLFNLGVVATAWAMLHAAAGDGLEWRKPKRGVESFR